MQERLTFDSEPLIAYFLGEPGGEIVKDFLFRIQRKEADGFINVINLAEVYDILYRLNPILADENCRALENFGLAVLQIEDDDLWRSAAKIKAAHAMSLADAFAVATAERQRSTLVIGRDKEYDGLTIKLIKIRA
jgi:predicted nucleic acid-binding protein